MTSSDFYTLVRVSQDPWAFLTEFVRTQDPARGNLPFPDYAYLRALVRQSEHARFLLVPKSRQMLVTWTMTALFLYRALFRDAGVYLFLSRNERCAVELLERTRFIFEQLPGYMKPRLTANSREELAFGKYGSRILSLPASPNGPRMYSPTAVFWDEMAFTPFAEQIWAALKPSLDSGGSFVGVSSSGGANNLFARLVLNDSDDTPLLSPEGQGEARSLFQVHRIHYTDHPDKQSAEWKKQAALGMSALRWQQEQEISFESFSDRVYDEFEPVRHVLPEEWIPETDGEIYRSLDFGFHHPYALWLQRTGEGQIIVFDEWQGLDATTEEMFRAIRAIDAFHGLSEREMCWTSCDPSGASAQDSGLSPVDTLRRYGLKIRYRPSRVSAGVECVKAALADAAGRTKLFISPRCRNLISDFNRYRWAAQGDEPLKDNICDHSMDALRYFFVNFESADEMPQAPRLAGIRR
jgi:hypothetical protein